MPRHFISVSRNTEPPFASVPRERMVTPFRSGDSTGVVMSPSPSARQTRWYVTVASGSRKGTLARLAG